MTPEQLKECRKEFEKEMVLNEFDRQLDKKNNFKGYSDIHTQALWIRWVAYWNLSNAIHHHR